MMCLLKLLEVNEMYSLISMTKRHILIFLRDKTAVFFSFLSVLILLTLYFLFIGRQFTSGSEMDLLDENLKTYLEYKEKSRDILERNKKLIEEKESLEQIESDNDE